MPKSPFTERKTGALTLRLIRAEEIPKSPKKKPQKPVKQEQEPSVAKSKPIVIKHSQPRKPKKSTLVSRFKKDGKVIASKEKLQPVIPKELVEQQEDQERSKKRRYSKFHPREGEQDKQPPKAPAFPNNEAAVLSANGEWQPANAEFIRRHNQQVANKPKSTVVLNKIPPVGGSNLKPLLDNQHVGLCHDIETLKERSAALHKKGLRLSGQLRKFSQYIPVKDMEASRYGKCVDSLNKLANEIKFHGEQVERTARYLTTKAVFETRHARTLPNCSLTNLSHEPATTRSTEELLSRLKRTPPVRTHKEHEEEANTMLSRHINTLKAEIEHTVKIASPVETLAAAQTGILNAYRECIRGATPRLSEDERRAYEKDLKAVVRIMKLVISEKTLAQMPTDE